jgi:hypothetical protein
MDVKMVYVFVRSFCDGFEPHVYFLLCSLLLGGVKSTQIMAVLLFLISEIFTWNDFTAS